MAKKLKKRADGRYAKQITIGFRDGKPLKKTVYGRTIQEVEKKYRDFLQLYEKGIVLSNTRITLTELLEEWYHLKKENFIQTNTKFSYETRMKVIRQTIGHMAVRDIRLYHIEAMLNDIIVQGHSASAKLILIMLKNVFDYAASIDLVYKNPCNNIEIRHTMQTKRILTDQEKKNILKADLDIRDRALISLFRYTGMRRGEVLALTREDIDLKKRTILINKTLIDCHGKGEISYHTKTEAGKRQVPILEALYKPLKKYLDQMPKQEYLFLNQNGKLFTSNGGYWILNRLRKKCELSEEVTFHTFRHTFITECYQAGVPVKKLQAWVGHANITTTLNIYTHLEKQVVEDCSDIDAYYKAFK